MRLSRFRLLALLSCLVLVAPLALAVAADEPAHLEGSVEVGVTGVDLDDNPARANEYVSGSADQQTSLAPSLDLAYRKGTISLDAGAKVRGPHDQQLDLDLDTRVFRVEADYQVFEHRKDHENLEHLGATMRPDIAGGQPRVSTDLTFGANLDRYYQELSNDYIIEHRETSTEAELTLPTLPNVTLRGGLRVEEREGLEQAITMSKCGMCHVQANSKEIDERTEDLTFGATGKFGMLTVDYEYLRRDFDANADNPTYGYMTTGVVRADGVADDDQLLYSGTLEYADTPDSEKDSHALSARLDLPHSSMISASYTKAEIESNKTGEAGTYSIDDGSLTSEFESFFLKGATRLGDWRLAMRGGTYTIDGPDYYLYFPDRDDQTVTNQAFDNPEHYESAESRDVSEFGVDGVYRLGMGTTLRLGYEYEKIDREEEALGDTTTNSFKVALKSRLNNKLSGRISYRYQDIDEPLSGAKTGINQTAAFQDPAYPGLAYDATANYTGDPGNTGTAVWYWNSVYPNRTLDTSVSPESVHEAKFSGTWAPSARMAATLFARVRIEENDNVEYKQNSYVPGVSIYYAPNGKLNLTMAYTFNKMETENQMCVGWYHG